MQQNSVCAPAPRALNWTDIPSITPNSHSLVLTRRQLIRTGTGHICPTDDVTRDQFMLDPRAFAQKGFNEAAALYLASRKDALRPRSLRQLEQDLKQAGKFFGDLRLNEIHIGHVKEYQEARRENRNGAWKRPANASIINHEISALQQLMKRADDRDGKSLWMRIAPWYAALPMPPVKTVKVLDDPDEMLWFGVLETVPECELLFLVNSITVNTGASGKELRTLRRKDIWLTAGRVPGFEVREEIAKNTYRARPVVMNATAARCMVRCLQIGESHGSIAPDHYVFPLLDRKTRKYDPTRPASESWLNRQIKLAAKITGLKATPHMFRHQHITVSIESGESPEMIAKRVGHGEIKMTRYYTHTRAESQLRALGRIDTASRFSPEAMRRIQRGGLRVVNGGRI